MSSSVYVTRAFSHWLFTLLIQDGASLCFTSQAASVKHIRCMVTLWRAFGDNERYAVCRGLNICLLLHVKSSSNTSKSWLKVHCDLPKLSRYFVGSFSGRFYASDVLDIIHQMLLRAGFPASLICKGHLLYS